MLSSKIFSKLSVRELYLEMREQLINQTLEFMKYNCPEDTQAMTIEIFRQWLDLYPFIRTQIREAMMPRLWSLTTDYAVKPLQVKTTNDLVGLVTTKH